MNLIRTTLIATTLLCAPALFAAETPKLETTKDKVSYAVGMNVGLNIKRAGFDVDTAIIAAAMNDALMGNAPALSQEEAGTVMRAYQQELQAKAKAEVSKVRDAGTAFLAENAKKPGVKTTASGLQYKILTEGKGEIPKANHTVTAHYRGTLIDGTEFDSSYKRDEPFTTSASSGVIQGWIEALQMMPVGSKWQLFIPADLAYGDQQKGPLIKPGSALIFELELLTTKGPEPIVSDIIKVPSAEEMKKGAKIETIKAEDVEKLRKEQEKQPK